MSVRHLLIQHFDKMVVGMRVKAGSFMRLIFKNKAVRSGKKLGRTRKWGSNAEKQRAYRERKGK
jgi:hypothetical protein